MTSQKVMIENKVGLHSRPASLLIQTAKSYKSAVSLEKGDEKVDLKSLVALLKLRVKMGDEVVVAAEGEDEAEAVSGLVELIRGKFGEE